MRFFGHAVRCYRILARGDSPFAHNLDFRDPERVVPTAKGIAVSPADGKIVKIQKAPDPFTGQPRTCVSVFMDLLSVHVAIESADIALMKSDLMDAVSAIQLSRAVMRTIRQNLFWAFFYNAIGITVAAGVFYIAWGWTLSPIIAAAAMSFSSVSVVSNALRLRLFSPKRQISAEVCGVGKASLTVEQNPPLTSEVKRSFIMKKTIKIEGMSCGHCTGTVEKALHAVPGVTEVAVDLASKSATVEAQDSVSDDVLTKAIADTGFQVVGIQ